jgi:hypothetical protein
MAPFDYLSVMVSIVIGVGLTQLFAGIGNVIQVRRRVKRYRLHSIWVLLLVAIHVQTWWSFWALRGVSDWTFAGFAYVLIGPALLVIASHVVLPERSAETIDAEAHYFAVSPILFALLAALAAWAMLLEPVMGLRELFVPFRLFQVLGVLTLAACAASRNKRLHAGAAAVIVVLIATAIALTRFRLSQLPVD